MKHLIKWAARVALLASASAPAQTLSEVTGFGSNPGNLRMFKVVPSGLAANRPLVVALHGCAQSAAAYDAETGWVALANRWQFALLLPQHVEGVATVRQNEDQRSVVDRDLCYLVEPPDDVGHVLDHV